MVLCHCDIHRKNCVITTDQTWFLDWELALVGDPVYDIAVHIHKMSYGAHQQERLLSLMASRFPAEHLHNFRSDVEIYLRHEKIKSVIVDSVRYYKQMRHTTIAPNDKLELARKLAAKLQAIANCTKVRTLTPDQIIHAFMHI
jgi:thiamine kinase-like enzyme